MLVNTQVVTEDPEKVVDAHAGELSAREVYQHELSHLALLRYQVALVPGWLVEGAAMYLSGERRKEAWSAMKEGGVLDRELSGALAPTEPGQGVLAGELYPYANAAVLYLVETFGPERFWTMYSTFRRLEYDVPPEQAQGAAMEKLLKDIYQLNPRSLDAAVRNYMKAQIEKG